MWLNLVIFNEEIFNDKTSFFVHYNMLCNNGLFLLIVYKYLACIITIINREAIGNNKNSIIIILTTNIIIT